MHKGWIRIVSKVIQIRDVPDEVHAALIEAAAARHQSLTRYLVGELEHLAGQEQRRRHNAGVVRRAQRGVGVRVGRRQILDALHEGRGE